MVAQRGWFSRRLDENAHCQGPNRQEPSAYHQGRNLDRHGILRES